MYKPTHFYLSLINVGASVLVSLLILKVYGASGDADAYFMGLAIVTAVQLLQLMMVDQFIYFYQERRAVSTFSASAFAGTVLSQCFIVSLLVSMVLWLSRDVILTLFAAGFEGQRRALSLELLGVLVWTCLLFPSNFVIHRLLNAEGHFSITYLLELILPAGMLLLFATLPGEGEIDIRLLAHARLLALAFSFMIGIATIYRLGLARRLRFTSFEAFGCYRNSLNMRLGHNIHNFLFSPITNNLLALLPSGSVALYYYADRLAQVISSVAVGPFQRVFQVEVGERWRRGERLAIRKMQRDYILKVALVYAPAISGTYLALPFLLAFLMPASLSVADVDRLSMLFLLLAAWLGVIAFEFAFVAVGLAVRKSAVFVWVNLLFITLYGTFCFASWKILQLYTSPLAAVLAQTVSLALFIRYSRKLLQIPQREVSA